MYSSEFYRTTQAQNPFQPTDLEECDGAADVVAVIQQRNGTWLAHRLETREVDYVVELVLQTEKNYIA